MSKGFDNGIDLSDLLWSVDQSPALGALSPESVAGVDQGLNAEIVRKHNEIVGRLAERLSSVTHFQFSASVSIVWRQGNLWSVSESGLALNLDGDWDGLFHNSFLNHAPFANGFPAGSEFPIRWLVRDSQSEQPLHAED